MSFQAPDTDADASSGFKAPEDDLDPPKSLEGFLGNVASNAGRAINPINIAKGLGSMAKQGLYDVPKAAAESSVDLLKGTVKAAMGDGLPSAEDVANTPILKQAREMTEPIAKDPAGYLYKNPVDAALLASGVVAPFLGGEGAAEAAGNVSRETSGAAAAASGAAKASKELPVIPSGARTGDPHALFAYNDKFGPGGTERSIYNIFGDPTHPAFQKHGWGSSIPQESLGEIPVKGRQPGSEAFSPIESSATPPPGEAGGAKAGPGPAAEGPRPENAPPPAKDPLQDVKDYIARNQAKVEGKPGWQEKAAKYVKNEVADLRAKDIGMRDPMIRSLDPKRPLEALKKAEDLMGYASEQGYFKPGLTNVARKDAIAAKIAKSGEGIGAVRSIGGQRAAPPIADIRDTIKNELFTEYGQKAGREIETVLNDFDRKVKADPSFQGLADVATYLNGEKHTFNKIGQNPGPTTDAANIISRMNNEALRKVLSPEEDAFYTKNLRDFGAHKKLEQMVASAARRGMTGRGAPGGALAALWQQLWDRGGYRMAGNIADRMSTGVLKNPGKIKTIPQFFEDLAHHAGDEVDDTIAGMYQGGRVPDDVRQYVSKSC